MPVIRTGNIRRSAGIARLEHRQWRGAAQVNIERDIRAKLATAVQARAGNDLPSIWHISADGRRNRGRRGNAALGVNREYRDIRGRPVDPRSYPRIGKLSRAHATRRNAQRHIRAKLAAASHASAGNNLTSNRHPSDAKKITHPDLIIVALVDNHHQAVLVGHRRDGKLRNAGRDQIAGYRHLELQKAAAVFGNEELVTLFLYDAIRPSIERSVRPIERQHNLIRRPRRKAIGIILIPIFIAHHQARVIRIRRQGRQQHLARTPPADANAISRLAGRV